jgi:ribose 5-phosphate isomerase A
VKPEDCALSEVRSGQTLGLGTGRAAERFIRALGERVRAGLEIRGVPTSDATAKLAQELGIPLVDLDAAPALDLAVDGADEIDPDGNLIKGYGGALLREKVVASSAARFWVLAGAEKRVERLGQRGRLPVEVLPFAQTSVRRRLDALGLPSTVRSQGGRPVLSDNGNILLDCALAEPFDPHALERMLRAIPGLLDTGLFLGMADMIAIEGEGDTEVREVARVRP